MLHHARTLKTLCQVKEAIHTYTVFVKFHLNTVSKTGKSTETESTSEGGKNGH